MGARQSSLAVNYAEYETLIAFRRALDAINPELVKTLLEQATEFRKTIPDSVVRNHPKVISLRQEVENVVALQGGSSDSVVVIQNPQDMYTIFARTGSVNRIQLLTVVKLLFLFFVLLPYSSLAERAQQSVSIAIERGTELWPTPVLPIDFLQYRSSDMYQLEFLRPDPRLIEELIALQSFYISRPFIQSPEISMTLTVTRDGTVGLKNPTTSVLPVYIGTPSSAKKPTLLDEHDVAIHTHPYSPTAALRKRSPPSNADLRSAIAKASVAKSRVDIVAAPEGLYVIHFQSFWHELLQSEARSAVQSFIMIHTELSRPEFSELYTFPFKDAKGRVKNLTFTVDRYRYSSLLKGQPIKVSLPSTWLAKSKTAIRDPSGLAAEAMRAIKTGGENQSLAKFSFKGPLPTLLDVVLDQKAPQTRVSVEAVERVERTGEQESLIPEFAFPYK